MRRSPLAAPEADPSSRPVAKLVASQQRRRRRIVDAAVELAAQGGFEAVRLRDVAERSSVALGTLYKYFRGKEDILLFAFNEGIAGLEQSLYAHPVRGASPLERVTAFFSRATRGMLHNPQLGSALIRAMSGGDRETAVHIVGSNQRMARLLIAALRDRPADPASPLAEFAPSELERELSDALIAVWFAALCGWLVGNVPDADEITAKMRSAARLMLEDGRGAFPG
jgi:AcrR family transcriptional regulator